MVVDLEKYASTFSKTSYDGSKRQSLIQDDFHVIYNFDDIARDICKEYRAGEFLSSADGLCFRNGKIFLLEFKNQVTRNLDRRVLQKKAFDSIYLLQAAVFPECSISSLKDKTSFYVIHAGSSSPSFDAFRKKASNLAGSTDSPVDFGLSRYGCLYSEIYTLSAKDFVKYHLESVV